MSYQIHFTFGVCRPEVNREDEECCINFAVTISRSVPKNSSTHSMRTWTNLISISFFVTASRTTSRMHGGGVIGRLSCKKPQCLSNLVPARSMASTYLVPKSAHPSSNWLLNDI